MLVWRAVRKKSPFARLAAAPISVRTLGSRVTVKEAIAADKPDEDVSVLVRNLIWFSYVRVCVSVLHVDVQGWVKSVRKQKELVFLDVSDGSTPARLQVVASSELLRG